MTIIAGFMCDEGVLFCSDTMHSFGGFQQMEASKLFCREYASGGRSVFSVSGDVHFAKMLLQHCEGALGQLSRGEFTLAKCRTLIERTLADDYAAHIYPHPDPKPTVEFLIGLHAPAERASYLLSTIDTSVNQLFGYDARGQGAYLDHFLLRNFYKAAMTAHDPMATVLKRVLEAFHAIKQYDDGCGRSTDVCWLGHDGRLSDTERIPDTTPDYPHEEILGTLVDRLLVGGRPNRDSDSRPPMRPIRRRAERGRKRRLASRA